MGADSLIVGKGVITRWLFLSFPLALNFVRNVRVVLVGAGRGCNRVAAQRCYGSDLQGFER